MSSTSQHGHALESERELFGAINTTTICARRVTAGESDVNGSGFGERDMEIGLLRAGCKAQLGNDGSKLRYLGVLKLSQALCQR